MGTVTSGNDKLGTDQNADEDYEMTGTTVDSTALKQGQEVRANQQLL